MVWGNKTDHANFAWKDQPHIIAASAKVTAVEEDAVNLAVSFAGPAVQGRVSVYRGHLLIWKDVAKLPEAVAAPPEGMKYLYEYINSKHLRHMRWYVPGGSYDEIRSFWRPPMDKAIAGDITAAKSIE
ncbi:MAG: hypothetical protein FJ029_00770 [Actinobacteria bacterium]|nr:hypothetical protein [Actinomycetota bacterium]